MGCGHGNAVTLEWGIASNVADGGCGCGGEADSLEKRVARIRAETAQVRRGALPPRNVLDVLVALTGSSPPALQPVAERYGSMSPVQIEAGLRDAVAIGILTEEEAGSVEGFAWWVIAVGVGAGLLFKSCCGAGSCEDAGAECGYMPDGTPRQRCKPYVDVDVEDPDRSNPAERRGVIRSEGELAGSSSKTSARVACE